MGHPFSMFIILMSKRNLRNRRNNFKIWKNNILFLHLSDIIEENVFSKGGFQQ